MQKHGNQETEASATAKTVRVLDEAGHEYEATYTKRAKGLVKHGRARFADDSQTVIILACPPNQNLILEDNSMNEQNNNTNIPDTSDLSELTELSELSESTNNPLTARDVFDQIVALQNLISGEYTNPLHSLSSTVGSICENTEWESDQLKCGAINAASTPYRMREETYQQMLALYQQMYRDLTSPKETRYAERREFMNWVRDCIDATQCGQDLPDFEKLWKIFG